MNKLAADLFSSINQAAAPTAQSTGRDRKRQILNETHILLEFLSRECPGFLQINAEFPPPSSSSLV